ncbi:MAG: hypothetical protein R3B48_13185 [Kofleriaceae bacterium]
MTRPRSLALLVSLVGVLASAAPSLAQPEPRGAHPRLLLDATLREAWAQDAKTQKGPVARAVRRCEQLAASPKEFARDGYMGLDWCHHLQACLIAHVATGSERHAATAMRYFTALLDDLQYVGDGKGGDEAARRDSGYSIRALGPYTALAYDWLHDHPLMTEALRQRARRRFAAWTSWYREHGYRARSPATNYHAGYLMAATLIAGAQGGEAGAEGTALWRLVVDELWRHDMARAFEPGGVLDGGDWAEGWQYGPLSVAEYAVTLRVMRRFGVALPAAQTWPVAVLRRHVYALNPSDRLFVGGDTEAEGAYLEPYMFTLASVALSDAAPAAARGHAVAELDRLKIESRDFPLFDALARGVGLAPVPVPRASWPTWYLATGTSTLHARTRWDDRAVWMVVQCSRTLDVDHFQPNAGNFVISRGRDDLIVDPSPYGSLSTLTGNAPTVDSPQLPPNYRPSQAYWSEATGLRWSHQTAAGVVVARCDYADQYKFQHRPSDVPEAQRDFVLLPSPDGTAATLVIADRADTTAASRALYLQFRAPAPWKLSDAGARLEVGGSSAHLTTFGAAAKPTTSSPKLRDCFGAKTPRGNCDAARFPVFDLRYQLPGPKVSALHALDVGERAARTRAVEVRAPGYRGVSVPRARGELAALWAETPRGLRYLARPGATLVIHDAVPAGTRARVEAKASDRGCDVGVSAGDEDPASTGAPLVLRVDARCGVTEDPIATSSSATADPLAVTAPTAASTGAPTASSPTGTGDRGEAPRAPRSPRSGCCGASTTPGSSLAMAVLVAAGLLARRRRRRPATRAVHGDREA